MCCRCIQPMDDVTESLSNTVHTASDYTVNTADDVDIPPKPLYAFLDPDADIEELKVPSKLLERYLSVMDVVLPDSRQSTCFTKAYGSYCEGTGSFLNLADNDADPLLRYFSPREVANIMCFPKSFEFPPEMTCKQKYRLLGNSLNVFVVACLLCLLFDVKWDEIT